jgi:predicted lipoprotein with Yx(FWY)xxD motif
MLAHRLHDGTPRPRLRRWALVLVVLGLGMALPGQAVRAQSAPTVLVAQNATLGPILTDANGMTLYVFMRDSPGVSACTGGCASIWPPFAPPMRDLLLPDGASGVLGVITRSDGSQQVTYNAMPLYYYSQDVNPGDTNGQGIGGVWAAATP